MILWGNFYIISSIFIIHVYSCERHLFHIRTEKKENIHYIDDMMAK